MSTSAPSPSDPSICAPPIAALSVFNRLIVRAQLTVLVPVITLALIGVIWGLVTLAIHRDRISEQRAHLRSSTNITRAFEEHTIRTINLIDQTLILLKREYELGQTPDLEQFYRDNKALSSVFLQIGFIGPDGLLFDSNIRPFKHVDLNDREHFRVHVAADSGKIFVGKPVKGRVTGKWSIQTTRRINRADGSFGGVLVGSVDPIYFANFYRDLDIGERGVVSLVGLDGIVRARRSGDSDEPGQDLKSSRLFSALAQSSIGEYEAVSAVDQIERSFTYRTLKDYPLVVTVGTETATIFADHLARRRSYVVMGVIATALMAAIGALLFVVARNLQREREHAESANRLKSEFLAHVSHELRTPLHGILGFADFLKGRLADPIDQESAQMIHESGQHLLAIVNSILDLAKIEAGKLELAIADEDLGVLLETVAANYRIVADSKGLAFTLDVDPAALGVIRCDRTRLVSMLNNLLDNALKFTEKGAVTLQVRRDGSATLFRVIDTGPGIPPEAKQTIFEKFRQADAFVTRRHGGTGLGLALVRELATLMGGGITLDSELGRGSTFEIRLPLEVGTATTPSSSSSEHQS